MCEEIWKRKTVCGQRSGTGEHYGGCLETQWSRNFLYCMKVILMMTLSIGEYIVLTAHFMQPGEASSAGTRMHSVALLARGSHENSQATQAVTKSKGCL